MRDIYFMGNSWKVSLSARTASLSATRAHGAQRKLSTDGGGKDCCTWGDEGRKSQVLNIIMNISYHYHSWVWTTFIYVPLSTTVTCCATVQIYHWWTTGSSHQSVLCWAYELLNSSQSNNFQQQKRFKRRGMQLHEFPLSPQRSTPQNCLASSHCFEQRLKRTLIASFLTENTDKSNTNNVYIYIYIMVLI